MADPVHQNSVDVLVATVADARDTVERVAALVRKLGALTDQQRAQLYDAAEELNNAAMILVDDLE